MTKFSDANDGHAQGHVRDMFQVVIENSSIGSRRQSPAHRRIRRSGNSDFRGVQPAVE